MPDKQFANVEEALEELLPQRDAVPSGSSVVEVTGDDWPRGADIASSLLRDLDRRLAQDHS